MTGHLFHKSLPHYGEMEGQFQCNSKGALSGIQLSLRQKQGTRPAACSWDIRKKLTYTNGWTTTAFQGRLYAAGTSIMDSKNRTNMNIYIMTVTLH